LDRDKTQTEMAQNTTEVPSDYPASYIDPNLTAGADAGLDGIPTVPAAPLPPATSAGGEASAMASAEMNPRGEAIAAAASVDANTCSVRVSEGAAVRSWNLKDKVSASAIGATCGNSIIRIMLETPEGSALYALQAPARDFGISETATAEEVREKLMTLLPTNAVRAAAYPAWDADGPAPTNTEFTRETYEAIRAANHPVICLKLPSASQRCVAADPATKQIKVFSRG
jgi:hypothetical protein